MVVVCAAGCGLLCDGMIARHHPFLSFLSCCTAGAASVVVARLGEDKCAFRCHGNSAGVWAVGFGEACLQIVVEWVVLSGNRLPAMVLWLYGTAVMSLTS